MAHLEEPTKYYQELISAQFPDIAYNDEASQLLYKGEFLDINVETVIMSYVRDTLSKQKYNFNALTFENALRMVGLNRRVRPIYDKLTSLRSKYAGDGFIRKLAATLVSDDPDIEGEPAAYVWLRSWMVGAVQRAIDPDHDPNHVLLIIGNQDLGKSTWIRNIGKIVPGAYTDQKIEIGNKDAILNLDKIFVHELGEYDMILRSKDAAAVKDFITKREPNERGVYEKKARKIVPLTSFIATTNAKTPLNDPTGNRRYLTLRVTEVDRSYRFINIDHVWAEAVHLYDQGMRNELTKTQKLIQAERNKQAMEYNIYSDYVERFFVQTNNKSDRLRLSDIYQNIQSSGASFAINKPNTTGLVNALSSIGITSRNTTHKGVKGSYYEGIKVRQLGESDSGRSTGNFINDVEYIPTSDDNEMSAAMSSVVEPVAALPLPAPKPEPLLVAPLPLLVAPLPLVQQQQPVNKYFTIDEDDIPLPAPVAAPADESAWPRNQKYYTTKRMRNGTEWWAINFTDNDMNCSMHKTYQEVLNFFEGEQRKLSNGVGSISLY